MSDNNAANDRYSRNSLFITPYQQNKIKNTKVLFGGAGLGSVIAETALRLGFENFVFLDADKVDLSNLNRQNYTMEDLGKPKVEAISKRLKAINPDVKIEYHQVFLTEKNISNYVTSDIDIVINALDYDHGTPSVFDEECLKVNRDIKIIHPGNFSWGAMVFVISEDSKRLKDIAVHKQVTFQAVLETVSEKLEVSYPKETVGWVNQVPELVKKNFNLPTPQMSVGANLVAGITTRVMFDLVFKEDVKLFPDVYFLSSIM